MAAASGCVAAAASLDAAWARALPKAELHSHLHGSIRASTLIELLSIHAPPLVEEAASLGDGGTQSLSECFRVFDLCHAAVADTAAVARITREMLEDAAADGVSYLEVRTTPRPLRDSALTTPAVPLPADAETCDEALHRYVAVVAHAVCLATCGVSAPLGHLAVRLIISVNRAAPISDAAAICRVARSWASFTAHLPPLPVEASRLVVGMDIGGDPTRGALPPLLALLKPLREAPYCMCVTVHVGETMNVRETAAVLAFAPERLGHACVLSPSATRTIVDTRPVIEICPSSNVLTLHLDALDDHPTIRTWLDSKVPFTICVDDVGVFGSPLSAEYMRVGAAFGLCVSELQANARGAFEHAFISRREKDALLAAFDDAVAVCESSGGGCGGAGAV